MKRMALLAGPYILLVILTLATISRPVAAAQYISGNTYFDNKSVTSSNVYPTSASYPCLVWGSVLPDTSSDCGGAIGYGALGINPSTNNRDRKWALNTFLKNEYNGPSPRGRVGAALIVHQLLGGTNHSRTVTSAEWDDLWNRLVQNDAVSMDYVGGYNASDNYVGVWYNPSASPNTDSNDDAAPYHIDGNYADAWVFSVGGKAVYALEIACANPLGKLPGLPPPPPPATATCDGLTATKIDRTNFKFTASATVKNGATIQSYTFNFGDGQTQTTTSPTVTHTYANAGNYTVRVTVNANINGSIKAITSGSCQTTITVEKLYSLTPKAQVSKTIMQPDDSVTVQNFVQNKGDTSNQTTWQLSVLVYRPGVVFNKTGKDAGSSACSAGTFTPSGPPSCQVVQQVKRQFPANSTTYYNPVYSYKAPLNYPIGTKVCFTASVSPPTQNASPAWRHSDLSCVTIGKRPKVQVWGGDTRVGDDINTSINTFTSLGRTYGSWGEYGALSNGRNSGFASGAGLNKGSTDSAQTKWSNLTFANSGGCPFGCYGFSPYPPSLVGQFNSPTTPASSSLSGLESGTYSASSLSITDSTIGPGKSIIIVATGTVTITGDITYNDGPYAKISDIPQVVIRAAAINITNSVRNVDAWLIAVTPAGTGTLNTCSDVGVSAQLTSTTCNNPLRVNGPVITDKLYLRRTAGSDSTPPESIYAPAEIFNLRADTYLWGNAYGMGTGNVRTFYTRELPPRL